jgi:hypothetical protein
MTNKTKAIALGVILAVLFGTFYLGKVQERNGFLNSQAVAVGAPGTNLRAEDYIPYIKYNDGYYSELGITTTGDLSVAAITATGAVTSSGSGSYTGANTFASTTVTNLKIGQTGTTTTGLWSGVCNIHSGPGITTIGATSTISLDCQSGTGTQTAIPRLPAWQAGDRVFITQPTTTPTTNLGVQVVSANASSTAGFITLMVANYTGATYTIGSTATSSLQYLYIR